MCGYDQLGGCLKRWFEEHLDIGEFNFLVGHVMDFGIPHFETLRS